MNRQIWDLLIESNNTLLSLFEVEGDEEKEEVNKIKVRGKDKDGNEVETVSVEDELFPYKGSAKEQFHQKVVAMINNMIEGKATLQDLIQLVRNGKRKAVKESLDKSTSLLEEIISEVSIKYTQSKIEKPQEEVIELEKQEEMESNPKKKENIREKRIKAEHKLYPTEDHIINYHIKKIKKKK